MLPEEKYFRFDCKVTYALYPFYGVYQDVMVAAVIVTSICCPIITCLNALVAVAMLRKRMLQTPSNILLLNTSISDFCVGFVTIPMYLLNFFMNYRRQYNCLLYTVEIASIHVFTLVSFNMVMMISVDRVIAIFKPFFYHQRITAQWKNYYYLTTILWLFLTLLLIVLIAIPAWYMLLKIEAIMYITICIASFIAHLSIHFKVKKFRKIMPHGSSIRSHNEIRDRKLVRRQAKTTVLTFLMLVSIITCFIPYGVAAMCWLVGFKSDWLMPLTMWSFTMVTLKSLINPLLFCYSNSKIYKQVKQIASFSRRDTSLDEP